MFISTAYWNSFSPNSDQNVDVVISDRDTLIGSYEAANVFGVRTQIRKYRRTTAAIFDHAGQAGQNDLFPTATESTQFFVGALALSATEARALKPTLSLAFVVRPKAPYLLTGSRIAVSPSLDVPKQIVDDYSVLIADIQCGLVLDGTGKVLAAYVTR